MTATMSPISRAIPSIHESVVRALAELSEIVADERADAGQIRYQYASLAAVMRTVRPLLARHDLAVSQLVQSQGDQLGIQTIVAHVSGDHWDSGWLTVQMPSTAQQVGSWVSYLRRYQLLSLLGLAVEDDDGRSAQQAPARAVISDQHVALIRELFAKLGLGSREDGEARLALTGDLIQRDVQSLGELSELEVVTLIEGLQGRVQLREEQDA